MPYDTEGSRRYRRLVVALLLCMGAGVAWVGARLAWQGKGAFAGMALLVLAWLMLVIHGYRQDERERKKPGDRPKNGPGEKP